MRAVTMASALLAATNRRWIDGPTRDEPSGRVLSAAASANAFGKLWPGSLIVH